MSKNKKGNLRQQAASIDFQAIVAKYKRYWWLLLISVILCLGAAFFYLHVKKPVYLIVSTVLVDQDNNSSGAGAQVLKSLSLGGGGSHVDDEVIVMGSQELCRQMIEKLGVNRTYSEHKGFLDNEEYYNNAPIAIDAPAELFDTLMVSMKPRVPMMVSTPVNSWVKPISRPSAKVSTSAITRLTRSPWGWLSK